MTTYAFSFPKILRTPKIMSKVNIFTLKLFRSERKTILASIAALVLIVYFNQNDMRSRIGQSSSTTACTDLHSNRDGGDCAPLHGNRRPDWACLSDMRASIKPFLKFYEKRPVSANKGGMRIDHSFAFWYMLQKLQPKTVIESGAWNGQSTWIIRSTLPKARIISMDPREPLNRLPDVEYYVKDDFVDFSDVDWSALKVDPSSTLVFVDDHQMSTRRMFQDNKHGFRHFIIDDNYPITKSKFYSLKGVCNWSFKKKWRGYVTDNFGAKEIKMTWNDHIKNGEFLSSKLKYYYEFPPLGSKNLVNHKYADTGALSTAIVNDKKEFNSLFRDIDAEEFTQYLHMAYAEIRN